MAIIGKRSYNRVHRLEEGEFSIDSHDVEGRQVKADALKLVKQGEDERAVSLLHVYKSVKVVDTTPAAVPDEVTVKMSQGRNEIEVPTNVVSWSPDAYEWAGRFQLRGQKVYDTENRTYAITDSTITSLKADVTWLLTWDECPEAFNRWITIRSARVFSDRVLSDDSIFKYTALDESNALTELQRVELEQADANSLTGGPGLNPFST